MNVLFGQDVSPQETGEGAGEGQTEGAVVDAQGHGVDGGPKGAVADGDAVDTVDFLPCLNDTGEEDCGSDVGAGELKIMLDKDYTKVHPRNILRGG